MPLFEEARRVTRGRRATRSGSRSRRPTSDASPPVRAASRRRTSCSTRRSASSRAVGRALVNEAKARRAECLVLAGRFQEALEEALTLRRPGGHEGAGCGHLPVGKRRDPRATCVVSVPSVPFALADRPDSKPPSVRSKTWRKLRKGRAGAGRSRERRVAPGVRALREVDDAELSDPDELEMLGEVAWWTGRVDESIDARTRVRRSGRAR